LFLQRGLVLLSLFDANCAQIINTSAGEVAVTAMSCFCLEQLLLLPLLLPCSQYEEVHYALYWHNFIQAAL